MDSSAGTVDSSAGTVSSGAAAPDESSLFAISRGRLTSNEPDSHRRERLKRVLLEYLPEWVREKQTVRARGFWFSTSNKMFVGCFAPVRIIFITRINIFRGDLTDISAQASDTGEHKGFFPLGHAIAEIRLYEFAKSGNCGDVKYSVTS